MIRMHWYMKVCSDNVEFGKDFFTIERIAKVLDVRYWITVWYCAKIKFSIVSNRSNAT